MKHIFFKVEEKIYICIFLTAIITVEGALRRYNKATTVTHNLKS